MSYLPLAKLFILLLLILLQQRHDDVSVGAAAAANEERNCNIPLTTNNYDACNIAFCLGQQSTHEDSFVCDISAQWMHHVGGEDTPNDWYPATPPKGTGVHEYVAYTGEPPCTKNGHCRGCDKNVVDGNTNNIRLCSIFVDPTDCSVTCPSHSSLLDSRTSSASATTAAAAQSSSSTSSWILVAVTMVMAVSGITYYFKSKRALQEFVKVENLTELASLNK